MSTTLTQRKPGLDEDEATKLTGDVKYTIDTNGNQFEVPNIAIKTILDAIPKSCYDRPLGLSLSYVARDLFLVFLFGYCAISYIHLIPSFSARVALWIVYGVLQGLVGTGCWVLAHECGHGAFSSYKSVNNVVGWILHSALMVPYFSWQISHSKHHKATGHLTRDMVFVPREREEFMSLRGLQHSAEDTPIMTLYYLLVQQLFGWNTYLLTNVTGQTYPGRSKWVVNHFVPTSPVFDKKDYYNIILSDIGVLTTLSALYYFSQKYGFSTVALMWGMPWLWVNHWLVHITYLQHTDPQLPHYDPSDWTFARGAMATIDRDFGFIGEFFFHDIIETHVLHHFCSRIPFYHGRLATEEIKKVLGKHYRKDDANFITSLYKVARACQFVEGNNGVKMFRNINNVGAPSQAHRLE